MAKIIITGCAGFLGSHLSWWHLSRGDNIVGIDNFCSSNSGSKHFAALKSHMNFSFIEGNICDFHLIDDAFTQLRGGDIIYNFACPASPPRYASIPIETMMTCVVGTKNVLDAARRRGATVVHASTSEVYGDPLSSPQNEADRGNVNSFGPRACYDEGKRAAEALCFDYLNKYNVDARLCRIFNTYGPHMDIDDGRVVTNFVKQAFLNQDITIYGNGEQTRSFCYVDDLIRGITLLGTAEQNHKTPVNLGNPREFTVVQLADLVVEMVGSSSKIIYEPLPTDDPRQRCPDISLAKHLFGWQPTIELREGLTKMIPYVRDMLAK